MLDENYTKSNDAFVSLMESMMCYNLLRTNMLKPFAKTRLWRSVDEYITSGGKEWIIYDVDKDKFHMELGLSLNDIDNMIEEQASEDRQKKSSAQEDVNYDIDIDGDIDDM